MSSQTLFNDNPDMSAVSDSATSQSLSHGQDRPHYPINERMIAIGERELFAAVGITDAMHSDARLPASIELDFDVGELVACFQLASALWSRGLDREPLMDFVRTLIRKRDLDAEDRVSFKRARARFKHLRFAHMLYGKAHRYPRSLDVATAVMGTIQDAYRAGRGGTVLRNALLLRVLLSGPALRYLRWAAGRLTPTSAASFRALLLGDVDAMAAFVGERAIDGARLHRVRKIVGRQRSFWDTLRTIAPTDDRRELARELATLNSLMGDLHDTLVDRQIVNPAAYAEEFELPDAIRERMITLVRRYREAAGDAAPAEDATRR